MREREVELKEMEVFLEDGLVTRGRGLGSNFVGKEGAGRPAGATMLHNKAEERKGSGTFKSTVPCPLN